MTAAPLVLERLDRQARATIDRIAGSVRAAGNAFSGRLREASGPLLVADIPGGAIGHVCRLFDPELGRIGEAEIVGFRGSDTLLAPFGVIRGLSPRVEVLTTGVPSRLAAVSDRLGCVVDCRGEVLTRFAPADRDVPAEERALTGSPPDFRERRPITQAFVTGVRPVDGLLTLGEGQRIGILGNAGLGKSTCVQMIVEGADVDIVVLGLVGERGREVTEWVDRLAASARAGRVCVVAATSDRPAVERMNAALAATAIAESYRDAGLRVLLVIDSLTRVARAARDLGLARGEPPTRRGFPPSVFDMLPPLIERAGVTRRGSITGLYCVLVEGEVLDDPVAEEAKALLDGHIILSPEIAASGIYPAIDLLQSRSRSMRAVVPQEHAELADRWREITAAYERIELLLRVGEYKEGQDELSDKSLSVREDMRLFLTQRPGEATSLEDTLDDMRRICA